MSAINALFLQDPDPNALSNITKVFWPQVFPTIRFTNINRHQFAVWFVSFSRCQNITEWVENDCRIRFSKHWQTTTVSFHCWTLILLPGTNTLCKTQKWVCSKNKRVKQLKEKMLARSAAWRTERERCRAKHNVRPVGVSCWTLYSHHCTLQFTSLHSLQRRKYCLLFWCIKCALVEYFKY